MLPDSCPIAGCYASAAAPLRHRLYAPMFDSGAEARKGIAMTIAANTVRLVLGIALAGGAATLAARGESGNEKVDLVPHRAVYDLKLAKATGGQRTVAAVRGRILYDFSGSVCEGYGLNFRQVSEIDSGEGKTALSDLRATSWEEGAAKSLRFTSQNYLNQDVVTEVEG